MDLAHSANAIFWACFVAAFFAVAIWESLRPHAPLHEPAERRWKNHGALFLSHSVFTGLTLRISPIYYSILIARQHSGLFPALRLAPILAFPLGILALDLMNYLVHRLFHAVPFLWRVHEIHHSDRDFDVSTGFRFHPLEALSTASALLLAVRVLGPSPLCVLAAVLLSVAENFFAHANGSLPAPLEKLLRPLLITPDSHRLHHSCDPSHFDRNFGQTFSFWDRLFGTWREPAPQRRLATGVPDLPVADTLSLRYLLTAPFQNRTRPPLPELPVAEK
jgi:sterol desaturase/sphingolipid hydroxylase (fatty acid hydroxylase superfamily)